MTNIRITVSAQTAGGKSTIAKMIFDVMRLVGFHAELVDDNELGVIDEAPDIIESTLDKRIAAIQASDHKITIQTQQTPVNDRHQRPDQYIIDKMVTEIKYKGLVTEIKYKDAEITDLRQRKFARFNNEDCWIYQGDGNDNLESLVCPVVISADDLLQLINNANKQIQPIRDRFTV